MKGSDVKLAFLMTAACAVGLSSAWGDGLTDDFVRQADRTGTVAFLIEGLCGVSEADLAADFELTSFSRFGKRRCYDYDEGARHPRYGSLVTAVKSRPGATLAEKIEDYAIRACGLRPEEVAAIRRCLVKGERRN